MTIVSTNFLCEDAATRNCEALFRDAKGKKAPSKSSSSSLLQGGTPTKLTPTLALYACIPPTFTSTLTHKTERKKDKKESAREYKYLFDGISCMYVCIYYAPRLRVSVSLALLWPNWEKLMCLVESTGWHHLMPCLYTIEKYIYIYKRVKWTETHGGKK